METIHNIKITGLLRTAMVLVCAFYLAVLTVACDDEDSFESKLEEAKIAVDDGNYDKAVNILGGMTGKAVLEVLASAYAGQAGIDTFEILSEVDNDDGAGDGSIDLIGKMLGAGEGNTLTCDEIDFKLSKIDLAKSVLIDSVGGTENLDNDGKTKLAIYSFVDFVLIIGKVVCKKTGGGSAVALTEKGIHDLGITFVAGDVAGIDLGAGVDPVGRINEDIDNVNQGITALGGSNDLAEEFIAFLQDVDPGSDGVDEAEFIVFLNDLGN